MIKLKKPYRIEWTYSHALKSVSRTRITKRGIYIGLIRHTVKHWRRMNAVQMAMVEFDGNKTASIVPFSEIKILTWKRRKDDFTGTASPAQS